MELKQKLFLFAVSALSLFFLFVRQAFIGADTYAYISTVCVSHEYGSWIGSDLFTQFLYLLPCNFYLFLLLLFFAVLLIVFSWAKIGELVEPNRGWLVGLYVLGLSPALFMFVTKFEQATFGYALSSLGLCLFWLGLTTKNVQRKRGLWFFSAITFVFSIFIWKASVLMAIMPFFILGFWPVALIFIVLALSTQTTYAITSLTQLFGGEMVAEEAPIIGLFFIAHFLKSLKEKDNLVLPTIIFLVVGLVKLKYIFLSVPFFVLLLIKHPRPIKIIFIEIKNYKLASILAILIYSTVLFFAAPSLNDLALIDSGITLSQDQNIELLNDWDAGWWVTSRGYDTKYKCSLPDPTYTNPYKDFVAITKDTFDLNNCKQIKTSPNLNLYRCYKHG